MNIDELDLPKKIIKILDNENITTVEELADLSYDDLRYNIGFGRKAISNIENALDIEGYKLKGE